MKRIFTILLVLISINLSAQQTDYKVRDSLMKLKVSHAADKRPGYAKPKVPNAVKQLRKQKEAKIGIGLKPKFDRDSAKSTFTPLYDSLVTAVTYMENDGKTKTDTCIVFIYASEWTIVEDFAKANVYGMTRFSDRYVGVPGWKVTEVYRPRNQKTLNKNRIVAYAPLTVTMTPAQARERIAFRPLVK